MFRFTIRELILLTVIVAMGAEWAYSAIQAARLDRELRASKEELTHLRAYVEKIANRDRNDADVQEFMEQVKRFTESDLPARIPRNP